MSTILTAPAKSGEKRRLQQVLGAVIAFAFLTASSHIAVPVGPVPMTLTGVFLGPRLGAAVTAAWVACGFSGLPLFAMGNGGLAAMVGPTAGYLYTFPVVAFVTGFLAGKGGFFRTLAAMVAGNALCLALGTAWLAAVLAMPVAKAVAVGAAPFVVGGLLKSVLGALIVKAARR